LYATVHGESIIYIGKASYGNAVYKEAKQYWGKYAEGLREMGIIPETFSKKESYDYVYKHCLIYVGVVSPDTEPPLRQIYIDFAEKLILNKIEPMPNCNKKFEKYDGVRPFKVVNKGIRPPSLLEVYETT
jgi:hypothetical protein